MTSSALLLERGLKHQRVAILGIGNELNGDDAAGVLVARELFKITRSWDKNPDAQLPVLYIVEAGAAPEAFTGPLRRFEPDVVILVDSAELGEPPGSVAWFDWQLAGGMSASTHTLPPTVLAQFLMRELGCEVVLIGIQPKSLDFDAGVSVEAQHGVEQAISELLAVFTKVNFRGI